MGRIPPHAERVFKGVLYDTYQWEQELYDGSTTTFEALRRRDDVVVIPVQDEKLLLTYDEQPNRDPVFTFPGGAKDDGETVEAAASRELLEETGYQAAHFERYTSFEVSNKIDWTVYVFIARDLSQVAEPNPGPGEKVRLEWKNFEEFLQLTKDPRFQHTHLALDLYRMSNAELEQFRKRLFGQT